jgi:hypothetical protein
MEMSPKRLLLAASVVIQLSVFLGSLQPALGQEWKVRKTVSFRQACMRVKIVLSVTTMPAGSRSGVRQGRGH